MRPFPKKIEVIALVAMLSATIAFAIDAMLPALPEIAQTMTPHDINRAQFIVTSFVFGMGLGTLIAGPLSDRFGRRPIVLIGTVIYVLGAMVGAWAQSLETLLLARLVQGIGAAGPRIVSMAILRDLYSGREMARTISFVMIVFTLVPAVAPLIGTGLIAWAGWPAVFWAFAVFATIACLWFGIRMPETLAKPDRRPFTVSSIWAAIQEMFASPVVRWSIVAQGFCFGILFSMISTVQPIYDNVFDRADSFPYWFGAIAVVAGTSSFVNAVLVMRVGMRKLVTTILIAQLIFGSAILVGVLWGMPGDIAFLSFVFWQTTVFFQIGLTLGNLNAIAMEPMGHVAGLAASIMGSIATVIAVVLAAPISLNFDGTILPLVIGILTYTALALVAMMAMARAEAKQ
ncbi:multidrug effflux MFS transporter [uncultured Pelagimonas sp.]|uniref:multidrug effflux MFS transporter n=1 Tax=uncultured Pelagimonas sp. TaxID=1618102 RepID=UPI002631DB1A|nr:multidrug effflux MFS transporter [uncultured Pelagimonas sp.]